MILYLRSIFVARCKSSKLSFLNTISSYMLKFFTFFPLHLFRDIVVDNFIQNQIKERKKETYIQWSKFLIYNSLNIWLIIDDCAMCTSQWWELHLDKIKLLQKKKTTTRTTTKKTCKTIKIYEFSECIQCHKRHCNRLKNIKIINWAIKRKLQKVVFKPPIFSRTRWIFRTRLSWHSL